MEFFKTDDGLLHVGRIGAIFYVVALVGGCLLLDEFDRLCVARTAFTGGWCLALGGKHVPKTFKDLTAHPLRMLGVVLAVLGIAGQFYFTWARHHPHG